MIDAMKGTELPAAAPKPLSPSAEAQSLPDEAEATLWHSAQQVNSRTVAPNISLNAEQTWLQMYFKKHTNQSRTKQIAGWGNFRKNWFQRSMPSKALARGRVCNIVANLCVEVKLDLASGLDI